MAVAWFIVGYERVEILGGRGRRCAIDRYTDQLAKAGGDWREVEMLGNRALVKVRAPAAVLDQLATVFRRLPKAALDEPLADLSAAARTALRDELEDAGYSRKEITATLGDLSTATLGDLLRFVCSSRQRWGGWDEQGTAVLGERTRAEPLEAADEAVR